MAKKRTQSDIQEEIDNFQALVDNESVPQDERDFAKGEIEELEKELKNFDKKAKTSKKGNAGKKNLAKVKEDEVDKDLNECKELIQANRKPRPEPVHHNKATRFDGAIKTVLNVLLEDNKDPKTIKEIERTVTTFIVKCKEKFLDLKITKPSEVVVEKLETALETAEA